MTPVWYNARKAAQVAAFFEGTGRQNQCLEAR
jgi:hypothetical protein